MWSQNRCDENAVLSNRHSRRKTVCSYQSPIASLLHGESARFKRRQPARLEQ